MPDSIVDLADVWQPRCQADLDAIDSEEYAALSRYALSRVEAGADWAEIVKAMRLMPWVTLRCIAHACGEADGKSRAH